MSRHVKGFIAILLVGTLIILGVRFALPWLNDRLQRETSDASVIHGVIRIGMDNWIGYFPLCSQEMVRRMRQQGYALRCEDDQADYAKRFKRLAAGELELAVATVDSYLLNGAAQDYPGVIVAVIDESKGGDAILAWRDRVPNLNALKDRPNIRLAFTPASPSEHLLKAIGTHFDLPVLSGKAGAERIETEGSSQALEKLLDRDVDVAVLWEPDVSRAKAQPGIGKLIGTEDTDKLIVDILLVERHFAQARPDVVKTLLEVYFQTLQHYHAYPGQLSQDLMEKTAIGEQQVAAMLAGVAWSSLSENAASWFGITQDGIGKDEDLIDAINAALKILQANGDFASNPLPDGDPFRLTNRQFIAELFRRQGDGTTLNPRDANSLAQPFAPLDEAAWGRLKEVGNLKVEPVSFRRGSGMLDHAGKLLLDKVVDRLRRYPNFRVIIKGHTGQRGDPQANLALSAERAEAVARYLIVTYNMDPNRIKAVGYGSSQPLPRLPDESNRAYAYRLPRVELTLATETF